MLTYIPKQHHVYVRAPYRQNVMTWLIVMFGINFPQAMYINGSRYALGGK